MQQKLVKQAMNDGTTVGKSLLWHMISYNLILYIAKVGTFPLSYAVIPSFISCFTTLYCKHPLKYILLQFKVTSNNT